VGRVGLTHDRGLLADDANRRAVALLFSLVCAIELQQHGVVDVRAEGILDRIEVGLVAVRGQLHAMPQAPREVLNERCGTADTTRSYEPARNELCVCVDGRPRPDAADSKLVALLLWRILILRADVTPDFVALNPPAANLSFAVEGVGGR